MTYMKIRIPHSIQYAVIPKLVLSKIARDYLYDPETIEDVKIAIHEVCCAVFGKGPQKDSPDSSTTISLLILTGSIFVAIKNECHREFVTADPNKLEFHKLIVKTLMDTVTWTDTQYKARVIMMKARSL